MGGASSTDETDEKYNTFVGKPQKQRSLGRPRLRWKITAEWSLGNGWEGVECELDASG
jgi:hypothetical protein